MNNVKEISLDIGFVKLLVGVNSNPDFPEAYICMENKDGDLQDIILVRAKDEAAKTVECLVWTDEYTDDPTHEIDIRVYEDRSLSTGEEA